MESKIFQNLIFAQKEATNWDEAVDVAGKIWLENECCEQKYIDLIKEQLVENNAYAVVIPGVILLHATSGFGVKKNTLMLITLRKPVEFGHETNDPVKVMICFTSIGKDDHLENMQCIANMLFNDEFVNQVSAEKTDEELKELIIHLEQDLVSE